MIFKTFNNDIDKISAKWGIFGKSFYDFVDIANKRRIKIDDLITYHGMSLEEAKNEVGSLWSNLFPSKKDLQIDIDSLIPEFDTDSARLALEELQNIQAEINRTKGSWDDYHDKFKDGKEYLLDYAKTNNVLESSVDDVKQANQSARDAAIAHNAALKQQTLSAKAGAVAMKALAVAGNMAAMWAITKGIELAISAIDKYIVTNEERLKQQEEIISKLQEEISAHESKINSLEDLQEKIKETNGEQSKMLALSEDINNVLGEGQSKILEQADAYAVLSEQISRAIEQEIEYQNRANLLKRNAEYAAAGYVTVTDTTGFNQKLTFSDLFARTNMVTYRTPGEKDIKQKFSNTVGEYYNQLVKEFINSGGILTREESAKLILEAIENVNNFTYAGGEGGYDDINISEDELKANLNETLEHLYNVYDYYINNGESFLSANDKRNIVTSYFLNNIGELDDIEIANRLASIFDSLDDMGEEINGKFSDYYNALTNDVADDEVGIYNILADDFEKMKSEYPEFATILDWYFNDMITRLQQNAKKANLESQKLSFYDIFNAESFSDSAKTLKELAISGEISPSVLQSTKVYRQLLEDTGLTAEEAIKKIREIAIGESSISDIMGSLQSHAKLINKVNDEISSNGQISFDTLQSIAQSYPTLEKYVTNYLNGVEGASEDLINTLNEGYKTDLDNYSEYYTIKQANDEIWWDDYVTNTNSWVNQVANAYKVDLVNYTSYLEAKQDIENRIAQAKERAEKAKSEREKAKPTLASMASGLLGATHNKNMNDFSSFSSSIEHSAQVEVDYLSKLLEEIVNSFESGIQGTTNNISDLFKSTDFIGGSSSSTSTDSYKKAFDDQLATLKHQLAMNQITEAQYYNTLDKLNKQYFANRKEYLSEYRQYEEEVYKGLLSVQKDSLDAINDLIDLRKEMIKDIKQDEIDALEKVIEAEKEKLDAINKSIDARKKAIELLKDEKTHDEEMAERNKAISDIQIQIDRLKLDNSASAQKKRRELEEELAEKQKDLADYITDYEYDKAMEALDNEADIAEQEYEQLEENLNNQIDAIQSYLDDEKQLLLDATNDINGMNKSLFDNMKNWAYETTGSVQEVVEKWKEAQKALELYNSTNNVSGIKTTLEESNYNNKVVNNNAGTVNTSGGSSGTGSNNITSSNHNTSTTATTTPKSTRYHTVQSSADTMWNLAKKYYGDGTKWTKIQQANGGIDPRSLRIGQRLIIPYKNGTKKVPENQLALYDEVGEELILRANGQGKLGVLTKGSSVIPADLTENLMKWGEMNPDLLTQNLNVNVPPVNIPNFERKELVPVVNIGDININGNMGNLTKSDLNEFRKGIVNDVYESMQKNRVKSGRY